MRYRLASRKNILVHVWYLYTRSRKIYPRVLGYLIVKYEYDYIARRFAKLNVL